MIKKNKTDKGFTIFEINKVDLIVLNEVKLFGQKCDSCNAHLKKVYYIPVLNRGYCPKCYKEWYERATYFTEDEEFEQRQIDCFEYWLDCLEIKLKEKKVSPSDTERKVYDSN